MVSIRPDFIVGGGGGGTMASRCSIASARRSGEMLLARCLAEERPKASKVRRSPSSIQNFPIRHMRHNMRSVYWWLAKSVIATAEPLTQPQLSAARLTLAPDSGLAAL